MKRKFPTKEEWIARTLAMVLFLPGFMYLFSKVFTWAFWISGMLAVAVAAGIASYAAWLVRKRQAARQAGVGE